MRTQSSKTLPLIFSLAALALSLSVLQPAQAQNWVSDIPLKTARWNHTATLLTNGLVLIAGGEIFNDSTNGYFKGTNSAELYNPVTGASTLTAPMNDAHWGGSAMLLTNGLVLVAGGRNNGGSVLATAELYDPSSGTWSNTGSLHQQRSAFTATLLPNGKVLVVGGQNNSAVDTATAELYDPVTGTWANTTSASYATDSAAAVLLPSGKVLFCGGSDGLGGTLTNAVLYNPTNQTWANTGPMHTARGGHVLTLLPNGQVLVVGGVFNESAELYTPATGLWTNAASMNDTRSSPTAALLPNGQVLVLGGEPWLTSAELYNPTNNTWTLAASLHVARFFNTTTPLGDGQVVVTGGNAGTIGYYNGPPIASVETYDGHPIPVNHTLVAHYPFDAPDGYGPFSGQLLMDTSGNGYNIDGPSTSDGIYPILTTDCIAGESAIQYDGNNWHLLPTNLLTTIAGTCSISLWLKTTQVSGNDSDAGPDAPGIVWAGGASDNYYDSEPVTLTGSKLGFYTGDDQATLHSVTSINSGAFTHIVVTRDQPTGVKRIYINGVLDSTSTGGTNFLSDSTDLVLGESYYNGGVAGIIDDVQFYSGLLSAADVAYLHANPGSEAPVGPPDPALEVALNTTNLVWTAGGDANWFVETTNTHDSVSAAQSGAITDYQQTWIQTAVTGPGTLTFWWQVSSEGGADFLEFDLDEIQQDEISGTGQDWAQETYSIPSGTHTLRWLYSKDGSFSDGADAGFLDEVSYVPTTGIIVTASPLTGLVPLTVQFTSPGVDSGGNTVTNWNWNFGDGATSTAQSPSHIYTNVGGFWPSLEAYSTFGASPLSVAGLGTIIVTNHTLNVSASPHSGPLPLAVQFTSPSVDSGGNTVTNWNWNFGDGTTNTAQNPSHVYTRAGSFSPSLLARSTHGAWPLAITGPGAITVTNIPNPAFRTLYGFAPISTFGFNSGLVLSGNTLYGTTSSGGTSNWGMLFAINTSGSGFTNLHNFNYDATNGARPSGVVLSGSTLYGPTDFGGTRGGGTVYAISTNGTGYTNLYNLNFNVDPYSPNSPQAPLVLGGNSLYGATWYGGYYNHGTLFSVATNGANNGILHSFITPSYDPYAINYDGIYPSAKLIYSGGTLYGTAEQGGYSSGGTVFAVSTNGSSFTILHYFTSSITGTNSDGANPWAGLVLSGSTLYGTTLGGGSAGNGVVFAVNTNGSGFTNLHSFTGGNGGTTPHAGLVLAGNTLYGTTAAGGTSDYGTLFAINTDGSGFTTLYSFTGGDDGATPQADLVLSGNTLYGTANAGGSSGGGTVFSFTLSGPLLTITPAGTNVILTWSTSAIGYALQSTVQLGSAAGWNSVSPSPVIVNGQNTVTNPITGSKKFYRLSQ